jgi:flagellar hook-associated protein 3 FlgL
MASAEGVRTSTASTQQQVKRSMDSSLKELARVTKQVTSGKRTTDYLGISEKITPEDFTNIKNSVSNIHARTKNNGLLKNKLNAYDHAITGLQELSSNIKVFIQQAKTPASGQTLDVVSIAKNYLGEVKHYLSSQFNSQHLFSGSKLSTDPLNDIVTNSNILLNTPTASYYQGDNELATSKISDENILEYGILGNHSAFQNLIGGLHRAIEARVEGNDAKFLDAYNWVHTASSELSSMLSKVGNDMDVVDSQLKMDEQTTLRLNEFVSQVEDTDTPEAMAELISIQAQLQAAYMLLVRINSSSLADYIK